MAVYLKWAALSALIATMVALALICSALNPLGDRTLDAGLFYLLFDYLRRVAVSFSSFSGAYSELVKQSADVQAVSFFLFESGQNVKATSAEHPQWTNLKVREVSFGYDDQSEVFSNLSLSFKRGSKIALLGPSGSGKSTLLSMLRGLTHPRSGYYVLDNTRIDSDGLNKFSALFPQDPEIFSTSVMHNVTMGTDATESSVLAAIEKAGFMPVLKQLPDGLNSLLAEKGANLSGGEKQRLALARSLFHAHYIESSLILLDEPTSSIDESNELTIYQNLLSAFSDCCIVASFHRLALVELFDEVVLLQPGKPTIQLSVADFLEFNRGLCVPSIDVGEAGKSW